MRLVSLILAFCLAALPLAAQTLTLSDDPSWVDIAPIPEGDATLRAEVEGGQDIVLGPAEAR